MAGLIVRVLGNALAAWAAWRCWRSRHAVSEAERIQARMLEQMPPDLRGPLVHDLFAEMAEELAAQYALVRRDWEVYGNVFVGPEGRIDPERVEAVS